MRDAASQRADGFHLLRLTEPPFQLLPFGHITRVAMHHALCGDGMERPGDDPLVAGHLDPLLAESRIKTLADDGGGFRRQHVSRVLETQFMGQVSRCLVEVIDGAV